MKTLKSWTLGRRLPNGIELNVEGRHVLRVVALEDQMFRVSLKKDGAWRLPRTWSIAPSGDVPWEGRSRDDMSGFTCPTLDIDVGDTATLAEPEVVDKLITGRRGRPEDDGAYA